jgi:D-alanine-D-alanine ligase
VKITDAKAFGRVAVVMGGSSEEREVSLTSGQAVLKGLKNKGVDARGVDGVPALVSEIVNGLVDRVFNILHGRGGENGAVQGALESLGVPYTGSGILGSAVTMDKPLSKRIWRSAGLPTPPSLLLNSKNNGVAVDTIGFPVMVKPAHGGSTIGVHKVDEHEGLGAALADARKYDRQILVERYIAGGEYTAGILQGKALPLIRLETPHEIYDYSAKYESDSTQYHIPAGFDDEREEELKRLASRAFSMLSASGWGRVDFMVDEEGSPWLLEVNTTPGMTSHSLVPMAAKAVGIGFDDLVWRILETSFDERP